MTESFYNEHRTSQAYSSGESSQLNRLFEFVKNLFRNVKNVSFESIKTFIEFLRTAPGAFSSLIESMAAFAKNNFTITIDWVTPLRAMFGDFYENYILPLAEMFSDVWTAVQRFFTQGRGTALVSKTVVSLFLMSISFYYAETAKEPISRAFWTVLVLISSYSAGWHYGSGFADLAMFFQNERTRRSFGEVIWDRPDSAVDTQSVQSDESGTIRAIDISGEVINEGLFDDFDILEFVNFSFGIFKENTFKALKTATHKTLTQYLQDFWKTIVAKFSSKITFDEVNRWKTEIADLEKIAINFDPMDVMSAKKIRNSCSSIRSSLAERFQKDKTIGEETRNEIESALRKIEGSMQARYETNSGKYGRVAPVCLVYSGAAGKGKTTHARQVAKDFHVQFGTLHGHDNPEASADHSVFEKKLSLSQWDGYESKNWTTLFFDDPDTITTADGTQSIWAKMIDSVNSAPLQVDIDIGKTKEVYINSPLVMITTNITEFNTFEHVKCVEAIQRRLILVTNLQPSSESQIGIENFNRNYYESKNLNYIKSNEPDPEIEFDLAEYQEMIDNDIKNYVVDVSIMIVPQDPGARKKIKVFAGLPRELLVALAIVKYASNLAYHCINNRKCTEMHGDEIKTYDNVVRHKAKIQEAQHIWNALVPFVQDMSDYDFCQVEDYFTGGFDKCEEIRITTVNRVSIWGTKILRTPPESFASVMRMFQDLRSLTFLQKNLNNLTLMPLYTYRYMGSSCSPEHFEAASLLIFSNPIVKDSFYGVDEDEAKRLIVYSLYFVDTEYILAGHKKKKVEMDKDTAGHRWLYAMSCEFPDLKDCKSFKADFEENVSILKEMLFSRSALGIALSAATCLLLWKQRRTIQRIPEFIYSLVTDYFTPLDECTECDLWEKARFKDDESATVLIKKSKPKHTRVRNRTGRVVKVDLPVLEKVDEGPRITIESVGAWRSSPGVRQKFLQPSGDADPFEMAFRQHCADMPDPEIFSFISSSLGVLKLYHDNIVITSCFITYISDTLAVCNKHYFTDIINEARKACGEDLTPGEVWDETVVEIFPPIGYKRQYTENQAAFIGFSMTMSQMLKTRVVVISEEEDPRVEEKLNTMMDFGDAFWFRHPFKSIKSTINRYLTYDQLMNNPKFKSYGASTEYQIRRPVLTKLPGKSDHDHFQFYIEQGDIKFDKTFITGALEFAPQNWLEDKSKVPRYAVDIEAGLHEKIRNKNVRERVLAGKHLQTEARVILDTNCPLSRKGDCGLPWMIKFEGQWRPLGFHSFKSSPTREGVYTVGFHPIVRDYLSIYDTLSKESEVYSLDDSRRAEVVQGISNEMMEAAPSRKNRDIKKLSASKPSEVAKYLVLSSELADMGFEILGMTGPGLSESTQGSSSIRCVMWDSLPTIKSRHEYFEREFNRIFGDTGIDYVHKEPAKLRQEDFLKKIEDYSPSTSKFVPENLDYLALKTACSDVLNHFKRYITSWKIQTYQQALVGDDTNYESFPMKRSTSAGYPYKFMKDPAGKFMKKKIDVIGSGMDGRADDGGCSSSSIQSATLSNDVAHMLRMMKGGVKFPFVSIDNLKDEPIKVKLQADGTYEFKATRIFANAALQEIIIGKMLLGNLVASVARLKENLGFAIGMDINRPERFLDLLAGEAEYYKLRSYGAGDFSGFDAKQVHIVATVIIDEVILPLWHDIGVADTYEMKLDFKNAIRTLFESMIESIHLRGNCLYQWRGPLPSGHFLTAFWNSLYNHVAHAYCYHRILAIDEVNLEFFYSKSFYDNIYLCVMGDDSIFSVKSLQEQDANSDWIVDEFSQEVVQDIEEDRYDISEAYREDRLPDLMLELGLVYTSDTKSDVSAYRRKLHELTFLKCRFGDQGNLFEPLNVGEDVIPQKMILDPNSIMIPFIWDRKPIKADILQREFYDLWQNKIDDNCAKVSLYGRDVHSKFCDYVYRTAVHYAEVSRVKLRTPFRLPSFEESQTRLAESDLLVAMGEMAMSTPWDETRHRSWIRNTNVAAISFSTATDHDQSFDTSRTHLSLLEDVEEDASLGSLKPIINEMSDISLPPMTGAAGDSAAVVLSTKATDQVIGAEIASDDVMQTVPIMKHMSIGDAETMDIRQFAKKRFRIANGAFATSDTNNLITFPRWYGIYETLNNTPIVKNKLLGFQGFTLKGRIVIQINANPFMMGRYRMNILDTYGSWRKGSYPYAVIRNAASICQRTQLPGIDININKDSIVELPFETKLPQGFGWFNTQSTEFRAEPALILLSVINPLEVGASSPMTSCTWDMYMEIDDIKLLGSAIYNESNITAREGKGNGPIESSMKKISKTLEVFGEVPILKSFTEPAQYVSDLLGKAAHIWGWSSPVNQEPSHKMVQSRFDGLGHSATRHNALVVSTNKTRGITAGPVAGTDVDELSLDYLKKIESWIWNTSFTTSQEVGDILWQQAVSPGFAYYGSSKGAGVTAKCGPPISYLSNFYKLWRGTMRYRFKLSKTQFHSGRLLIILKPPASGFNNPLNVDLQTTQQYYHKVIWDIRASDEIIVEVPHTNLNDWNYCEGTINYDNGFISVTVLDKLVCPETVPQAVRVAVYVSGGDDFEFAFRQTHTPTVPVGLIQMEGILGEPEKNSIGPFTLGVQRRDSRATTVQLSTGEREASLRAILKCPSVFAKDIDAADGTTLVVVPHYLSTAFITAGSGVIHSSNIDMTSVVGAMYGAYRGGLRISVVDDSMESGQTYVYHGYTTGLVTLPVTTTGGTSGSWGDLVTKTIFTQDCQTGAEFEVPYVGRAPYSSTILATDFGAVATFTTGMVTDRYAGCPFSTVPNLALFIRKAGGNPVETFGAILRSAADDFDFQGFLSTPWWATPP